MIGSDFSFQKSIWLVGGEGISWGEGRMWGNWEEVAKKETAVNWRSMKAVERKRRDRFGDLGASGSDFWSYY